jgi:glutaredoxin-like YruB-family protein
MEIISVNSHADFLEKIKGLKKAYLLIYKAGSQTSDCAYQNLRKVDDLDDIKVFAADVSKVRDIHPQYGVKTAPTLLEFENSKYVKDIKGCNDPNYYKAYFENSLYQVADTQEEGKKQPRIILYTTPSCPWCNRLKHYLKSLNLRYHDIDVSKDPKIAEDLVRRTGQTGVPQAEINGQMVVGFDKPKIDRLLGIKA